MKTFFILLLILINCLLFLFYKFEIDKKSFIFSNKLNWINKKIFDINNKNKKEIDSFLNKSNEYKLNDVVKKINKLNGLNEKIYKIKFLKYKNNFNLSKNIKKLHFYINKIFIKKHNFWYDNFYTYENKNNKNYKNLLIIFPWITPDFNNFRLEKYFLNDWKIQNIKNQFFWNKYLYFNSMLNFLNLNWNNTKLIVFDYNFKRDINEKLIKNLYKYINNYLTKNKNIKNIYIHSISMWWKITQDVLLNAYKNKNNDNLLNKIKNITYYSPDLDWRIVYLKKFMNYFWIKNNKKLFVFIFKKIMKINSTPYIHLIPKRITNENLYSRIVYSLKENDNNYNLDIKKVIEYIRNKNKNFNINLFIWSVNNNNFIDDWLLKNYYIINYLKYIYFDWDNLNNLRKEWKFNMVLLKWFWHTIINKYLIEHVYFLNDLKNNH